MLTQVILIHFLAFIIFFLPIKVINMLTIMLDPQFKSIKVVHEFVGNDAIPKFFFLGTPIGVGKI